MDRLPAPGTHDWVELPVHYLGATRSALTAAGITVAEAWVDPMDPRDLTLVLGDGTQALVWDEVSGWRHGHFISGHKGTRTHLANEHSFGATLLPEPSLVAATVQCIQAGTPIGAEQRPIFRSYADLHDGTDEHLATYAPKPVLL